MQKKFDCHLTAGHTRLMHDCCPVLRPVAHVLFLEQKPAPRVHHFGRRCNTHGLITATQSETPPSKNACLQIQTGDHVEPCGVVKIFVHRGVSSPSWFCFNLFLCKFKSRLNFCCFIFVFGEPGDKLLCRRSAGRCPNGFLLVLLQRTERLVVISQTHGLVSQERLSPRAGTSVFIDLIPIMPSGEWWF